MAKKTPPKKEGKGRYLGLWMDDDSFEKLQREAYKRSIAGSRRVSISAVAREILTKGVA